MEFPNIYRPFQIKMLTDVLNEHCAARGITHQVDRESVALRLMGLFAAGAETLEDLHAGLEESDQSDRVA